MNKFVTGMLMGLVTINTMVAAGHTRPRLILGIVVDQLRTDYLEFLQETFGKDGFNKLKDNGLYFKDIDFRQTVEDAPSATAVVFTGAWPKYTGIPSALVYDSSSRKTTGVLSDPNYKGVNTLSGYSPESLQLSTITDEIAIENRGTGYLYSIAADPQQAVIMSGHAGKGAVWIDDNSGRWASTSYYHDFPSVIAQYDRISPLSSRIDTIVWKPLLNLERYPEIPQLKKQSSFRYNFPRNERNVYIKFKNSPRGNEELTDAAIACLKSMSFGQGESVDMLNLAYSVAPYPYSYEGDSKLELEDAYIRLDGELARLFEEVDRRVGLDNTLIFLTSTGYYNDNKADEKKYRIPTGEFSLKRAESLLNSYLSALYGNGDYVESTTDGKITLNRKLIEEKRLSVQSVREISRDFLLKMSGVSDAFTIDDILGTGGMGRRNQWLSIDPKHGSDIYLEFTPGWTVIDDTKSEVKKTTVKYGQTRTPAFIMGPNIRKGTVSEGIDATILAPTITSALHIQAPNGSREKPLSIGD